MKSRCQDRASNFLNAAFNLIAYPGMLGLCKNPPRRRARLLVESLLVYACLERHVIDCLAPWFKPVAILSDYIEIALSDRFQKDGIH